MLLAAGAWLGAVASSNAPPFARWARDPPPQKHLFVDAALFANVSGDALLVRHAPQPADVPLRPDWPWETFGFIGYHTVLTTTLRDGTTQHRMYYDTGWIIPSKNDFHRYTCLALSSDGVAWTKPNLGVATFMNSTENNIVWPRDYLDNTHAAGTVFIDANPDASPDAKYKMVAQWNVGGVKPAADSGGVYMMKSADGIAFEPMFENRSLDWSDTKNVMFFDSAISKYVAYIRIDDLSPNPHQFDPCPDPWLPPGRRVGRCLLDHDQLHDWSLAGCRSQGYNGDVQCAKPSADGHRDCTGWGAGYEPIRCTGNGSWPGGSWSKNGSWISTNRTAASDSCMNLGTCGSVSSVCNGSVCVVPRGAEPGPMCRSTFGYIPFDSNGTQTVLSFDAEDPSCMDIYTNSATQYEVRYATHKMTDSCLVLCKQANKHM